MRRAFAIFRMIMLLGGVGLVAFAGFTPSGEQTATWASLPDWLRWSWLSCGAWLVGEIVVQQTRELTREFNTDKKD